MVYQHPHVCSVCVTFHLRLQLHNAAGATQVTGLEYRHVKDLHVLMPAGVKVRLAFSQHCNCLKDSAASRQHLLFLPPPMLHVEALVLIPHWRSLCCSFHLLFLHLAYVVCR